MAKRWRQRMPAVNTARNGTALGLFFDAFSSREPVSASLENGMERLLSLAVVRFIPVKHQATSGNAHARKNHRNDRHPAGRRRGSPDQGTDIPPMGDRLHPPPRTAELRFCSRWILR